MDSTDLRIKDRRDDFPVFIHSELDDYGLNPLEFRVYARLARRAGQHGRHSESVPNMAKQFSVSDRRIQRALKVLVACALVARHPRPGKTAEYSLNPRSAWGSRKHLNEIRAGVNRSSGDTTAGASGGDTTTGGDMTVTGVVTPELGVVVTTERGEGTPFEGTPLKGGLLFNHFAVQEYQETLKPEPALSVPQAEVIAQTVDDSELSRTMWTKTLREWKGNNYNPRHAGKVVDKYENEKAKAVAGQHQSSVVAVVPRRKTIREEMGIK